MVARPWGKKYSVCHQVTASLVNLACCVLDNMASCFFTVSAGDEELCRGGGGGSFFFFLDPHERFCPETGCVVS